ncbi:HAD family acid phosphatase [Conexibacter sp. CPCC 206217]|uniref:HAD family acid phosphatase n=1 Tax=Conexibacter sp. CPCC 206217 TaxID=3064574 RepID=UPI00271DADFB|nr:HAD family acid phosphatase [Conexibacter sp. CPCC 206217]MDO8212871.1 HAD family acid phosphatase [Conexibacter sp. CPCC 206217]
MSTSARTLAIAALLTLGVAVAPGVGADRIGPNAQEIDQIEAQYEGTYAGEVTEATKQARTYLRQRVRRAADPARLVAVFDVDETAITSYECIKRGRFRWARRNACVVLDPHPPIPQVLELYRFVRRTGVTIVFISDRPDYVRRQTLQQLRAAGYRGRYQLFLRPTRDRRESVRPFKSGVRKRLERGGQVITLNIGDQYADCELGACGTFFKLPNGMYSNR